LIQIHWTKLCVSMFVREHVSVCVCVCVSVTVRLNECWIVCLVQFPVPGERLVQQETHTHTRSLSLLRSS